MLQACRNAPTDQCFARVQKDQLNSAHLSTFCPDYFSSAGPLRNDPFSGHLGVSRSDLAMPIGIVLVLSQPLDAFSK
jgi:hypothetical protein